MLGANPRTPRKTRLRGHTVGGSTPVLPPDESTWTVSDHANQDDQHAQAPKIGQAPGGIISPFIL